ncbi:MAG TPA: hypothetical protein VIS95_04480 [Solirubrobacterales bacterium]
MQCRRPVCIISFAALLILAATAAGCGDSDGGGYGGDAGGQAPTATATTPPAPPGASARDCGETTVAGTEGLRVTGVGCDVGRGVVATWMNAPGCIPDGGASRSSCTVHRDYRCLAAATDRGLAVSCARPGSSIAFFARRPRDT